MGKVRFTTLRYLCFIVRSRMYRERSVCSSSLLLFAAEAYPGGREVKKKTHDFLFTLFLWFACHKMNHSKPVIQFPLSWSPKEYIFNLPVQHMFSGKGGFWHQDYFRAASKCTVCGCLTSKWRNLQRTCTIGVHARGCKACCLFIYFEHIKVWGKSHCLALLIKKKKRDVHTFIFLPTGKFTQIT